MQEFSIYFNRKDCYEDLNILLKEPIYLPPNNEEIETISIEGRNGSLTRKKGTFSDRNIDITFVLPHLNKNEMYEKIEEILDWLENRIIKTCKICTVIIFKSTYIKEFFSFS